MALDLSTVSAFFKIADQDRDGVLSGGEAVGFFSRSGLSQDCLRQIWELSSGGGASLNTTQFGSALRLVSLAQHNGGQLPLTQARVVLSGLGPALPAPRLTGMQQFGMPSYSPQTTGTAPMGGYATQATGGSYQGQATGGSYQGQVSGGVPSYSPQTTGPSQGAQGAQFPPANPADIQRYQGMFLQLDTDKDSMVSGSDCFGFFLQWGLDKSVLRDIWASVAGQAGSLNGTQFVQCIYLMDLAKKGVRPPAQLPPGPFPPVAGVMAAGAVGGVAAALAVPAAAAPPQQWSLQSQYNSADARKAEPAPALPPMPTRANFNADSFQADAAVAATPVVAQATLAAFTHDERSKVTTETREAEERELKKNAAEAEAAKSKARIDAYTLALQEITVFKSKMDVALINAEDQERRLKNEAGALQKRYDQAYSAALSQNESSKQMLEQIHSLMSVKSDTEAKIAQLQVEMAAATKMSPAELASLETEVATLTATCVQTEAAHSSLTSQIAGIKKQTEVAEGRLAECKAAAAGAEAELEVARKELGEMQAQVAEACGSGQAGAARDLLLAAAKLYRSLYSICERGGVEVPANATIDSGVKIQSWADDVVAGVADWTDDDDADLKGFVVVNALSTTTRLPPKQAVIAFDENAFRDSPLPSTTTTATATKSVPAPAAATAATTPLISAPPAASVSQPQAGGSGFEDGAFGESNFTGPTTAAAAAAAAPAAAETAPAAAAPTMTAPAATPPVAGFAVSFD